MRPVIDTATWQRDLNLALPFADGFRDIYVKFGGDNDDPTYESPYYEQQVNAAIALGFEHVGAYYVPNADPSDADDIDTPAQQADFMLAGLHRWDRRTGFVVLDNENLDGAVRFNDAQAAEFVERGKAGLQAPGRQFIVYTNLNDARAHEWPLLLETGCMFIIAAPSYPPGELPVIPTIPADRIVGHQYGTRVWGGVTTDVNVFWDHAFEFGGDTVYNPFASVRITGTWEDHASYSAGGTDYPLAYGTRIPAPASGILRTSGGSGEWACGWVGTAGRRSILSLDKPISRRTPRRSSPFEAEGPMVAIVLQHQSAFGAIGWHAEGTDIGVTGASASGSDWGGDVHLHWHGLDASGNRLRVESFLPTGTAGGGYTPIEEDDMFNDQDRANLTSVLLALGAGGLKPGGWKDEDTIAAAIWNVRGQTSNINEQVTGANGFDDRPDHQSVARRVIDIQTRLTAGGVDVDALAAKVTAGVLAGIPAGSSLTEAQVEAAVRRVFADAAD